VLLHVLSCEAKADTMHFQSVLTPPMCFVSCDLLGAGSVYSVGYSPDGTRIVSGSYDKTLKLWDSSGTPTTALVTFTGHTSIPIVS